MPVIPCIFQTDCIPCDPVLDTQEGLDTPRFLSVCRGGYTPRLGVEYDNLVRVSWCFSSISQAAADACCLSQLPEPPPVAPTPSFDNQAQSAECDNGMNLTSNVALPSNLSIEDSTLTVAAGSFSAETQAEANSLASSYVSNYLISGLASGDLFCGCGDGAWSPVVSPVAPNFGQLIFAGPENNDVRIEISGTLNQTDAGCAGGPLLAGSGYDIRKDFGPFPTDRLYTFSGLIDLSDGLWDQTTVGSGCVPAAGANMFSVFGYAMLLDGEAGLFTFPYVHGGAVPETHHIEAFSFNRLVPAGRVLSVWILLSTKGVAPLSFLNGAVTCSSGS